MAPVTIIVGVYFLIVTVIVVNSDGACSVTNCETCSTYAKVCKSCYIGVPEYTAYRGEIRLAVPATRPCSDSKTKTDDNESSGTAREKSPSWRSLLYEYTQETTMHGIRYITLPATIARRLTWLIMVGAMFAMFIGSFSWKIIYLNSNPKSVNVEVNFEKELPFPSVTICNENRYRLTPLFKMGLYDLMVNTPSKGKLSEVSECIEEEYYFYDDICAIPESFNTNHVSMVDTTRSVCRHLCSHVYPDVCSGVLYLRETRSCVLTPFTGNTPGNSSQCLISKAEFYRRKRRIATDKILCDFEDDLCELRNDDQGGEPWRRVKAYEHTPGRDNTLQADNGHFILIKSSTQRGTVARIMTPFINTTGKCLTSFYWAIGQQPAKLDILLMNEELVERSIFTHTQSIYDSQQSVWHGFRKELPRGIFRVILSSTRVGNGGFAIDDFQLANCDDEAECMHTRNGYDYVGKTSWSEFGDPCVISDNGPDMELYRNYFSRVPDVYAPNNLGQFCRNVPGLGWKSPRCFVKDQRGDMSRLVPQKCYIEYCDCLPGRFKCDNGFCIPSRLICDGRDDCGDNSDESEVCVSYSSITCDFKNKFLCGYFCSKNRKEVPDWAPHQGPGFSTSTSPRSASTGSGLDTYMLFDSRRFPLGKRGYLITPVVHVSNITKITFMSHQKTSKYDHVGSLDLFLANEIGFADQFIVTIKPSRHWQKEELYVSVPPGMYKLVFRATCGKPLGSDIAIDQIELSTCSDDGRGKMIPAESKAVNKDLIPSCTRNGIPCTLKYIGSHKYYTWTTLPETRVFNLKNEGCTQEFHTREGEIFSPDYPSNYTNGVHCQYFIHGPPGKQVHLSFKFIEIEQSVDCQTDKLLIHGLPLSSNPIGGVMCGNLGPFLEKYEIPENGSIMIEFISDKTVSRRGFYLTFEIMEWQMPENHVLVLKSVYPGILSGRFEEHGFLFTDEIPFGTYCIEIVMAVMTHTKVQLWYMDGRILKRDKLFDSLTDLVPEFQTFSFKIEPIDSITASTFRVVLYAYGRAAQNDIVALKRLSLTSGLCEKERLSKFEGCNFNLDTCGFLDQSPQEHKWHRMINDNVFNETDKTYHMQLNIESSSQEGILVSPYFPIKYFSCLTANIGVDSRDPTTQKYINSLLETDRSIPIYFCAVIYYSNGIVDFVHNCLAMISKTDQIRLNTSQGDAELTFEAYSMETDKRVNFKDLFLRIDSISLTIGHCTEAGISTINCTFDDPYLCGYTNLGFGWKFDDGVVKFVDEDGIEKKSATLYSKTETISSPSVLKIHWFATRGNLQLYTKDMNSDTFEYQLFSSNPSRDTEYEYKTTVCVPAGRYALYVYADNMIGNNSQIRIDSISLGGHCNTPFKPKGRESLYCHFENNHCDYIPFAEPVGSNWILMSSPIEITPTEDDLPDSVEGIYLAAGETLENYGTLTTPIIKSETTEVICFKLEVYHHNCPIQVFFINKTGPYSYRKTIYQSDLLLNNWNMINLEFEQTELYQVQIRFGPCGFQQTSYLGKGTIAYPAVLTIKVKDGFCLPRNGDATDCLFSNPRTCSFVHVPSGATGAGWAWHIDNEKGKYATCVTVEEASFYSQILALPSAQKCLELNIRFDNAVNVKVMFLDETRQAVETVIFWSCADILHHLRSLRVPIPDTARYYRVIALPDQIDQKWKCLYITSIRALETGPCITSDICADTTHALTRIFDETPKHYSEGHRMILSDIGEMRQDLLEAEIGHSVKRTLQSCVWSTGSCDNISVSQHLTELGQCINFNADGKSVITMTGAEHGLRLTLNIEQYEHVKGFGQNAGMKVHLHSHINLANVNDQGFAVAPNSHSHASCKYTQSESLGYPYGNCSSKHLQYYTGPYSKLKCIRECQTEDSFSRCGCRKPHLKGPGVICKLSQFLNCSRYNDDGNIAEEDVDCQCPDNCTIISHNVELSSGQISGLISENILHTHRDDIEADYITAVEIRHRVDDKEVVKTVTLLEKTVNSLDTLVKFMREKFSFRRHAKLGKVQAAVNRINQFIENQMEFIPIELARARAEYNDHMNQVIQVTSDSFQRSIRHIKLFDSIRSYDNDDSIKKGDLEAIATELAKSIAVFRNSMKVLLNIDDELPTIYSDERLSFIPSIRDLFVAANVEYCMTNIFETWELNKLNDMTHILLTCLWEAEPMDSSCVLNKALKHLPANSREQYFDELWTLFVDKVKPQNFGYRIVHESMEIVKLAYTEASKQFQICFHSYPEFLRFSIPAVDAHDFDHFSKEFTIQQEAVKVENFHLGISSFVDLYMQNDQTKRDLVDIFVTSGGTVTLTNVIKDIYQTCQRKLLALEYAIAEEEDIGAKYLIGGFRIVSTLQTFIPKHTNLTAIVRNSSVWRKPSVEIGSSHVFLYELEQADVEVLIWPKQQGIASFMAGSGEAILKHAVRGMFGDLRLILQDMTTTLLEIVNDVIQDLEDLSEYLDAFRVKLALDDKFVRDNFLKIDIYFGELKYENLQQSRAYDVLTLFSEMGGLMGLLIGGSVITLLEVLDLFIYNSIKRCSERKLVRSSHTRDESLRNGRMINHSSL